MTAAEFRKLLEEAGWTQRKAAVELGVTERTIAAWYRGERPIPETAARLTALVVRGDS